jgi:hypothetical protein
LGQNALAVFTSRSAIGATFLTLTPSVAITTFPASLIFVIITAGRAHAFFINRMLATLAHINFLIGCATLALPLVVVGVVSTAAALVAECALLVGSDVR